METLFVCLLTTSEVLVLSQSAEEGKLGFVV